MKLHARKNGDLPAKLEAQLRAPRAVTPGLEGLAPKVESRPSRPIAPAPERVARKRGRRN